MPSSFRRRLCRPSCIATRNPDPRAAPGPVRTARITNPAGWRLEGTNPEADPVHRVLITTRPPCAGEENAGADQETLRAPDLPSGL